MTVSEFAIGPLETNCFLIEKNGRAVVVDPGGEPDNVLAHIEKHSLSLTHILLTHLHFDHTYGVAALAKATGAKALGSKRDEYMLETELGKGGVWGLPLVESYAFDDCDAGELSLIDTAVTVLATPGHTPGGLSFYFPELKAVFSGDALFYRSIGRFDFPGGSQETLLHSIRSELFALPEETAVYPGHGMKSTIGDEKRNNPHVSDFSVV